MRGKNMFTPPRDRMELFTYSQCMGTALEMEAFTLLVERSKRRDWSMELQEYLRLTTPFSVYENTALVGMRSSTLLQSYSATSLRKP